MMTMSEIAPPRARPGRGVSTENRPQWGDALFPSQDFPFQRPKPQRLGVCATGGGQGRQIPIQGLAVKQHGKLTPKQHPFLHPGTRIHARSPSPRFPLTPERRPRFRYGWEVPVHGKRGKGGTSRQNGTIRKTTPL